MPFDEIFTVETSIVDRDRWLISNFEEAFNYHKLLIVLIIRRATVLPHSRHIKTDALMCLTARDRYVNCLLFCGLSFVIPDILTSL